MTKKHAEHTHTSHMHGVSRHSHGEHASTHGQTRHGTRGMHGQRRARHFTLPAQARRDVWRRQGERT